MDKIILNTDDEAAKFVTGIEGWVDRDENFWGKDEELARVSGCTHIVCPDCGVAIPKDHTRCTACREKKDLERYNKLERKQWDGKTPLYSELSDMYLLDKDDLYEWLEECGIYDKNVEGLRLVICEPVYLRQIETDFWEDELAEDGEPSAAVMDALDNLNAVLRNEDPASWEPGEYAAII